MKISNPCVLIGSILVAGCAAKNFDVLFDCSDSRLVDICKCDCWSAYCLQKGTKFTKADGDENDANRDYSNEAPGASSQCGEGGAWIQGNSKRNSIEEYPFASTEQGGLWNNQAPGLRCAVGSGQSGKEHDHGGMYFC